MKAYELIHRLMSVQCNTEVVVQMTATLSATVDYVDFDEAANVLTISGGDAEVISDSGESIGWLSGLAEVEQEA